MDQRQLTAQDIRSALAGLGLAVTAEEAAGLVKGVARWQGIAEGLRAHVRLETEPAPVFFVSEGAE